MPAPGLRLIGSDTRHDEEPTAAEASTCASRSFPVLEGNSPLLLPHSGLLSLKKVKFKSDIKERKDFP